MNTKKVLALVLIASALLLSSCRDLEAATYYISTAGLDTNSGTTEAAPFLHHPWDGNAAGTAASTVLVAGDTVIMRRGDIWYDTVLTCNDAGSTSGQITTTSSLTYGSGDIPEITGSVDSSGWDTGWSDGGGGVYSRALTTAPNAAYYSGSMLTKNTTTAATPAEGEFGWVSSVLYVHLTGDANPASSTGWRVPQKAAVVSLSADYLTFYGLNINSGNSTSTSVVYGASRTGIVIDSCSVSIGALHGVYLNTAFTSGEVKNCAVSLLKSPTNAACFGIYAKGSSGSSYYNNTISTGNIGISMLTSASGVNSIYSNEIYGQNTVSNSAKGVSVGVGDGWKIYSNNIHDIGDANGSAVIGINVTTNSNEIYGNTVHSVRGDGISLTGNSNQVYRNEVYNCGYKNLAGDDFLYYGYGGEGEAITVNTNASSNIVTSNNVHGNYCGISISTSGGTGGNMIAYNVAANQKVNGIGDYYDSNPSNRNLFYNNTVYHNPSASNTPAYIGHGIHVQDVASQGGKVSLVNNNVINMVNDASSHAVRVTDNGNLGSVYMDYNNVYSPVSGILLRIGTTTDYTLADLKTHSQADPKILGIDGVSANANAHTISLDPKLRSTTDFRLRPSSPCINAGVHIPGLETDFDGRDVKNLPDIGVYEFYPKPSIFTPIFSEVTQ